MADTQARLADAHKDVSAQYYQRGLATGQLQHALAFVKDERALKSIRDAIDTLNQDPKDFWTNSA